MLFYSSFMPALQGPFKAGKFTMGKYGYKCPKRPMKQPKFISVYHKNISKYPYLLTYVKKNDVFR